jgi:hypothetical protein
VSKSGAGPARLRCEARREPSKLAGQERRRVWPHQILQASSVGRPVSEVIEISLISDPPNNLAEDPAEAAADVSCWTGSWYGINGT